MERTSRLLVAALVGAMVCGVAAAEVAMDVRVKVAPPTVQIETPGPAPSPDAYWISGHWNWEATRHVWVPGHWVAARPGEVWARAHWTFANGEWFFHPGHWARIVRPAGMTAVIAPMAPPLPRVEVMTAPPSAGHFWVAGYWRWERTGFVWVDGRWELYRPGFIWAPAHWVRVGVFWHFAGAHWQRLS